MPDRNVIEVIAQWLESDGCHESFERDELADYVRQHDWRVEIAILVRSEESLERYKRWWYSRHWSWRAYQCCWWYFATLFAALLGRATPFQRRLEWANQKVEEGEISRPV